MFLICKGSRCAIQCGVKFGFCEEQVKRSQRKSQSGYCVLGKESAPLSRMPFSEIKYAETELVLSQIHTLLSNHFKEAPLNARQVARVTRMDCELYRGLLYISWRGGRLRC